MSERPSSKKGCTYPEAGFFNRRTWIFFCNQARETPYPDEAGDRVRGEIENLGNSVSL